MKTLISSFLQHITNSDAKILSQSLDFDHLIVNAKQLALKKERNTGAMKSEKFMDLFMEAVGEFYITKNHEYFDINERGIEYHALKNEGAVRFAADGIEGQSRKAFTTIYREDENKDLSTNNDLLNKFIGIAEEHAAVYREKGKKNHFFISNAKRVNEHAEKNMLMGYGGFILKEKLVDLFSEKVIKEFAKCLLSEKHSDLMTDNKVLDLRWFQIDAVAGMLKMPSGIILLPTGTGKTLVTAEYIKKVIRSWNKKGQIPVFYIMSPRIMLNWQLLKVIVKHNLGLEDCVKYYNLSSGENKAEELRMQEEWKSYGLPVGEIPTSTSVKAMKEYYDVAVAMNQPLVVVGTYHSAGQMLAAGLPLHTVIHDEAHNIVGGRMPSECKKSTHALIAHKKFYFTATMQESDSDEGVGMNNKALFGNVIYEMKSAKAIRIGEIVMPKIMYCEVKEYIPKDKNIDLDKDSLLRFGSITNAVDQVRKRIMKDSRDYKKMGVKILIVLESETWFQKIIKAKIVADSIKQNPKLHWIGLTSESKGFVDGKVIDTVDFKGDVMRAINNLKPEDDAVIIHIDMIGEGIDVPALNAVMPFQNLGPIKFVQLVGRASRLWPEDRENFYNGRNKANEVSKMIKPYSYVVIPKFLDGANDFVERYTKYVVMLRDEFEKRIVEDYNHSSADGRQEGVDIPIPIIKDTTAESMVFSWEMESIRERAKMHSRKMREEMTFNENLETFFETSRVF